MNNRLRCNMIGKLTRIGSEPGICEQYMNADRLLSGCQSKPDSLRSRKNYEQIACAENCRGDLKMNGFFRTRGSKLQHDCFRIPIIITTRTHLFALWKYDSEVLYERFIAVIKLKKFKNNSLWFGQFNWEQQ